MLAVGIGVLLLVLFGAVLRGGLALAGAWALNHYLTLPGPLGTIAWVVAGIFAFLQLVALVVTVGALFAAADTNAQISTRPRPPRRRRLR